MVDRIKITPSKIETFGPNSNLTFTTNENYLKTDDTGVFKTGGIVRAPSVWGSDSSDPYVFNDYTSNKGFITLLSVTPSPHIIAPNTTWEAKYYIPEGNDLGSIGQAGGPSLGGPMFGSMYESTVDLLTVYKSSTDSNYVAVASAKLFYVYWAFIPQAGMPPQAEGTYAAVSTVNGVSLNNFMLQDRNKYYKVVIQSNWHLASNWPLGSNIVSQAFTHYAPTVGQTPKTLSLAVTA